MGQHLCVLERFRVADKDTSPAKSLNGPFNRKMPPKSDCALSTSNEMAGVKSSLMKIFSKAWHPNRTTLISLPTEIILDLASYLPPSSYMSLSYSCRRIRIKMGASITNLLGDTAPICQSSASALSAEVRNIRFLERWELLCVLFRDGKPPTSKGFCRGCMQVHNGSEFPNKRLAQLVEMRRCLVTAGLVWICHVKSSSMDKRQF